MTPIPTNPKLEIVNVSINPNPVTYPFTNTNLLISLKNTGRKTINGFAFRIDVLERPYTLSGVEGMVSIKPGETYVYKTGFLEGFASHCKFMKYKAGVYNLEIKISLENPIGPYIDQKNTPFTLASDCIP